MTETAAIADIVLPAAQWGEKTGCFTNVDRTVHISHKAVDPPGEARPDIDIFVDFANRMDFRDKDNKPLIYWRTAEEAFAAWKRLSKGRPCDYSGLTYDKLTGGSGIQWPCTEQHPFRKERLFADGHFYTDIEYCESFGHDLETGAPVTKDEYKKLNPAGRAILKASRYIPSLEETNQTYPLQLSTGRNVYHFHTRTKTGRSKTLNDACPEPYIEVSAKDAQLYGIRDDEEVCVTSRRGAVQLKAKIAGISEGKVFIPFHFGYFDSTDGKSRAANELTLKQWDPISKQPLFKSGAVKIEALAKDKSEKPSQHVVATEQQSAKVSQVMQQKPDAAAITDNAPRQQHLELWLGATVECTEHLLVIYKRQIPRLIHDTEVYVGLQTMQKITTETLQLLNPLTKKHKCTKRHGRNIAEELRETLFPTDETGESNAYEALESLLALQVYYAHIRGCLTVLVPVSQALWDEEFSSAVGESMKSLDRMTAWVRHQMTVRAPQTLVVPSKLILDRE